VEVAPAARRYLLGQAPVTGYVQQRVYVERLGAQLDGTGQSAVVVRAAGGWAAPDAVGTAEYPVLQVECYSDVTRDPSGKPAGTWDNLTRAWAIYRTVNPLLHGLASRGVTWGGTSGLRVVTCVRRSEPMQADSSSPGRGNLGDLGVVSVSYNLEVLH